MSNPPDIDHMQSNTASSSANERAKELAGRHAASYVSDGMRVGLGTGSTVHHTIVALGEAVENGLEITCTATSIRTADLATSLGLRLVTPDAIGHLDLAIDGADEVDPDLNLTKGGGGAHTREKIIASMSDRFVVVVDETKLVEHLGPFGTPVEVLEFAPGIVLDQLIKLGSAEPTIRTYRSDNGNLLVDAHFKSILDPCSLGREISMIPGVIEHGIFPHRLVDEVVVAGLNGVTVRVHP